MSRPLAALARAPRLGCPREALNKRGCLSLVAVLAAACSAPAKAVSPHAAGVAPPLASPAPEVSGPARWIYTDRIGAIFDPSIPAPALPGSEPAILDGVRVLVTNGILDGWARSEERLIGFRRLPSRFGGGYALWSQERTYRADTFLGELTVLADVGASGGIRPWIGSLLLRTNVGVVLLDPITRTLRRADFPGLADAIAIDDLRAVRLDLLGRASVTTDGGATWTDVLAARGAVITGLQERENLGVTLEASSRQGVSLFFDREGHLAEPKAKARVTSSAVWSSAHKAFDFPSSSRTLPDETIARVVASGARLPGDRLLVARDGGLQVLAGATALPLDDSDLLTVDEKFSRCQPITAGSSPVLLACAGELGAEVLSLSGALGSPRLEATFPEQGLFVTGPRDRLGFLGRCGPRPASSGDLGPGTVRADEMPFATQAGLASPTLQSPELSPRVEPTIAEDARYCARISADRWVERRLLGDDARALYRFVPGDEGRLTALVLSGSPAPGEGPSPPRKGSTIGEGVRVIHLDPDDPALHGAAYPAVLSSPAETGYRMIDPDYWEDDDGAIRGWVSLPAPGETPRPRAATLQGPARRKLRVATGRGGRSAGVRIDRDGRVQVLPLPEGVTEVVPGGRFGLAQAVKDGIATTWETLDGGRTWTVIQGPPIGALEAPPDAGAPYGCSALGCTWGSGVVRLGWGGQPQKPEAREASGPTPPVTSKIRAPLPVKVTCSVDAESAIWATDPAKPLRPSPVKTSPVRASPVKASSVEVRPIKASSARPAAARSSTNQASVPISLRLGTSASIGQLGAGGSFRADLWLPFQPAAAARHLTATDRSLNTLQGAVIPLLDASPREPLDLLLSVGKRRLRVGGASPSFLPFDIAARITVAADGPGGELVALDPDKGIVWIARGEAVSAVLRLSRVADVSSVRFTLGRRVEGGGLVVVGYSMTSGEVFAGDLDLARGEVGPLVALGGIDTLTERGAPACSGQKGAIRFLADLDTNLKLAGKGSVPLHAQEGLAAFLIEASAERLCAAGMEVGFPGGKPVDLTVRFGREGAAAVRTTAQTIKGTCAVDSAPR